MRSATVNLGEDLTAEWDVESRLARNTTMTPCSRFSYNAAQPTHKDWRGEIARCKKRTYEYHAYFVSTAR